MDQVTIFPPYAQCSQSMVVVRSNDGIKVSLDDLQDMYSQCSCYEVWFTSSWTLVTKHNMEDERSVC